MYDLNNFEGPLCFVGEPVVFFVLNLKGSQSVYKS